MGLLNQVVAFVTFFSYFEALSLFHKNPLKLNELKNCNFLLKS